MLLNSNTFGPKRLDLLRQRASHLDQLAEVDMPGENFEHGSRRILGIHGSSGFHLLGHPLQEVLQ